MFMPGIFGENLFDDFFNDFARSTRPAPARPVRLHGANFNRMRTDVKEDEKGFTLDIELPGYSKDEIKAELKDGLLTICGEKSESKEEKSENGSYIRRERYQGSCTRSFYVGEDVTQEDIKASFKDGILQVSIPKVEKKPEIEENHYIAIEG